MAALEKLLEEALRLPDRERGQLAARLLRSLEPDADEDVAPAEWDAEWGAELDRRASEVKSGKVALVDGDAVLAELDALVRP